MALGQNATRNVIVDNQYLRSVIDGVIWDTNALAGNNIHWSLDPAGWQPSEYQSMHDGLTQAFALYESVTNLHFQEVTSQANAEIVVKRADNNIANASDYIPSGGRGAFPAQTTNGRVTENDGSGNPTATVANTGQSFVYMSINGNAGAGLDNFSNGQLTEYGLGSLFHELGHALGLKHPHTGSPTSSFTMPGVDRTPSITNDSVWGPGNWGLNEKTVTIMSYEYPSEGGSVLGLGALDIAALQLMYGVNKTYHPNNDVYYLPDPSTAGLLDTADAASWNGAIWDTGGVDEIRYDGNAHAVIRLQPADFAYGRGGGQSYTSNDVNYSSLDGKLGRGFSIADDRMSVLPNVNGETGVIIENATGGNGWDTIYGNKVDNVLQGRGGRDYLLGFEGNDILKGGADGDNLFGGADIDTADYSDSWEGVQVSIAGKEGLGHGGSAEGDYLYTIENLTGSAYGDRLEGNAENNVLRGGGGADTLIGKEGLDIADYSDAKAGIVVDLATGERAGEAALDTYESIEGIIGSEHVDTIRGTDVANVLNGLGGADTLEGRGGHDRLDGGAGADTMRGGKDDDVYFVDDAGDVVEEFSRRRAGYHHCAENIPCPGGQCQDLQFVGIGRFGSFHGIGNALNNEIYGGQNSDVLEGGGGKDTLKSYGTGWLDAMMSGRDTLIGGDGDDTLDGGNAADTYVFADGWDHDTVNYFELGVDKLDLRQVTGLTSFSQLTITAEKIDVGQEYGGLWQEDATRITWGDNSILLPYIKMADLKASDFLLSTPQTPQTFDGAAAWGQTIQGALASDTVTYEKAQSAIYADLERDGGIAQGLAGQTQQLRSIENLTGSTDNLNYLHGNAQDNVLIGGNTADWLTGRGGNNTLDGRGGVDMADFLETNQSVSDRSVARHAPRITAPTSTRSSASRTSAPPTSPILSSAAPKPTTSTA